MKGVYAEVADTTLAGYPTYCLIIRILEQIWLAGVELEIKGMRRS